MFKICLTLILILIAFPTAAKQSDEPYNFIEVNQFKSVPVLHDGRVKPLDSFAHITLEEFSNAQNIGRFEPTEWLALLLFQPDKAVFLPVFKVRNFNDLGLKENDKKLYSYAEIFPLIDAKQKVITKLLAQDPETWTPPQQQLIQLYDNILSYTKILNGITSLSPLNLTAIEDQKKYWQNLSEAHVSNNQALWDTTLKNLPAYENNFRIQTEVFYNQLHGLWLAGLLYGASLLSFIIFSINQKFPFDKLALGFLSLGVIANLIEIVLRVYILARPPIGTLFESVIFVALTCALGFLLIEMKRRDGLGTLLGSLSGLLLIITAKSFAPIDTMGNLVAVLNTNFWLLTHVITITIGYGVCFLTSLCAHYYLCRKVFLKRQDTRQNDVMKITKTLIILSLLFTTIGTILGGIWADQSWGRFWGWDPKENGALLIVLWIVWILHGRISKHVGETAFMAGAATLSIIVVLAWFGVNLLSVGLHSYGFISGVAIGIAIFCSFELLLIGGLWLTIHRKASS